MLTKESASASSSDIFLAWKSAGTRREEGVRFDAVSVGALFTEERRKHVLRGGVSGDKWSFLTF
jgi:hypothetical protein